MFPRPPLFINDDLAIDQYTNRSIRRRKWLMEHCHGPIVLLAPEYGPNQMYAWANCFCPVYQDSYILYLTGINQLGIAIILDPVKNEHHIFLPKYNSKTIFWDGDYFSYGDKRSHDFLSQLGFTHIHAKNQLDQIISQYSQNSIWHLLIQKVQKKYRRDDQFLLKQRLSRRFKSNFKFKNIEGLSWQQRFSHDATAINCAKQGAKKTEIAFRRLLTQSPFNSETQLAGQLIGELLKETCFGLSFSPIVARDKNAATLHYTANSEQCKNNSLILLDFGIRWQSMCTDVSRTIPSQGRYTDLQKRLMAIVLSTLSVTQQKLKAGVTFKELNDFAWQHLETTLQQEFLKKGGKVKRAYERHPHNIGHLLGIQVHDGDSSRSYKTTGLPEGAIITIEPGLYGEFEFNGECQHFGIRIEDNFVIKKNSAINLTQQIPKSCAEIEALLNG